MPDLGDIMFQADYSLFLYPTDSSIKIDNHSLIQICADMAFIDEQEDENRYQVGENFLSLVTFMGCSPAIEITPQPDNKPYCYIEFLAQNSLICQVSRRDKVPKCPNCKTNLNQLADTLRETCTDSATCPECSTELNPAKLNWRKSACFANSMIRIGNIYEAEAVPDAKLLNQLAKSTKCDWKYAYIQR